MDKRLFIFDCDGVLVDSEPLAAQAYVRVYAKHGLTITPDVIAHCVGMKQADILKRINDLTGQAFPLEHEGDIWLETRSVFQEALTPVPGIKTFLERLDVPCCVASSSSIERIEFSLTTTGLIDFFNNDIFSSSMVKKGKPAPDLFLYAADKMGVAPAHCIVIEDSPFGVQGAVAAGMAVIGFTGGGHSTSGHRDALLAAGANRVYSSWHEIALRTYPPL
ncbi:HAD-IA family hydrolase [Shinella sp. AETb1-6]|uniref:HAD family hydrolase n=1 Tax=Shinella TaxID=323620 RepID=UPI00106DE96C|nr:MULTISPECIES: HAD family phosphatase [Shinella]MCD1267181.1 HAD-IA family hydrolase [Shinella sumterensis]MXN54334.1 HAD-IA family hydrolase [Shinella sp. AETb1-6]TFE93766.1 HAD family hydrolase [Shinella sumterensis]